MGVLVPCVLTWWHTHGRAFDRVRMVEAEKADLANLPRWMVGDLVELLFFTIFYCGPGAVILAGILMAIQRKAALRLEDAEGNFIWKGTWFGAGMAYLNFPGYLSIFFFEREFAVFRTGMLFFVTGATCGAWIAWQAYKERHPERGFLPGFSLRTLVLFSFGWGGLLWLFRPA